MDNQNQAQPEAMPGLTEGRIVHYVLDEGPHKGEHRPAMILKVWNHFTGYVNLLVFIDGTNDLPVEKRPNPYLWGDVSISSIQWVTSVTYSESKEPRTWHWIEKA